MNIEDVYTIDVITGEKISLDWILREFERRIELLEEENIATTNNLYELMNDVDSLKLATESWEGSHPPLFLIILRE
jgi:hypothetical protein